MYIVDPNDKKPYYVWGDAEAMKKVFAPPLYHLRALSLTPEEDEALADMGSEVASGEVSSEEAIWAVAKYKMAGAIRVFVDGKYRKEAP